MDDYHWAKFGSLYSEPSRNGLTKPKRIRGQGHKLINMGEIFRYDRLRSPKCDRAPLTETEKKTSILKPNDLLFARQSLVLSGAGKCSIFLGDPEEVSFESHIIRIRINGKIAYPLFYYYLFRSTLGRALIESIVEQGAGASGIRGSDLKTLYVPCPKLFIQCQIADFLSDLDDKIELNHRMNETLEAMARAIFKDWFVYFGPTRAKAEGRAPYLAPELWELFPDALDDEGKPVGWEQGTLADVAEFPRRSVNPAEVSEKTPYIGLEHMPRRSIALSEWEGAGKVKSNKTRFHKGEVLFGKLRPYFHKVGIAPLEGICSTDIVVVAPRSQEWGAFSLACLSSDEFVDYTTRTSTGTKMPRTSWKTMSQYKMRLPPERVAGAFQCTSRPLLDCLGDNIRETSTLAQTRDLLLPKLMSGEIGLGDAEQIVEAVA